MGREFGPAARRRTGDYYERPEQARAPRPSREVPAELEAELLDGSAAFAELWAAHEVSPEPSMRKALHHPLVGPITLTCNVLDISDRDQQVVIIRLSPALRMRRL